MIKPMIKEAAKSEVLWMTKKNTPVVEPTDNLNSEQGKEIMELFKKLNKNGTTIVQVTHSEEKAAYGTRIINLLDGRIVKDKS